MRRLIGGGSAAESFHDTGDALTESVSEDRIKALGYTYALVNFWLATMGIYVYLVIAYDGWWFWLFVAPPLAALGGFVVVLIHGLACVFAGRVLAVKPDASGHEESVRMRDAWESLFWWMKG
jgi:hypothetical protein